MSALQWLAIPLIATLVAATWVPLARHRTARGITGQQRAEKLRAALERRGPATVPGPGE